jgi:hypothetical protein
MTALVFASARRGVVSLGVVSRRVGCGVLLVAAVALSAGPLAAGEPTCVVAYDADRVTAHAERVPLADLVREIGRQSGAEILGHVRKPRDVSLDFDRVPLVDALGRLLREQNFTLRYGPEGKLRTIELLGEPLALAAAQTTGADASNPDKPASTRRHRHRHRHGDVRSSRETLPDGQVLVSVAAGTDTGDATNPARPGDLSEPGGTTQEQSTQTTWPPPDELDRKLRRRFLDLLAQMDETALSQYFATPEGQRAQALLEDFAAHHPDGRSNKKANDILGRMPGRTDQAPQGQR